jgi:hypothetical protein
MAFAAMLAGIVIMSFISLSDIIGLPVILFSFLLLTSFYIFIGASAQVRQYKISAQQQALYFSGHLLPSQNLKYHTNFFICN